MKVIISAIILGLTIGFLGGCASDNIRSNMTECRKTCGDKRVKEYNNTDGICTCSEKSK